MASWLATVRNGLLLALAACLAIACSSTAERGATPGSAKGITFSAGERGRITSYYTDARRRPAAAPAPIYKPGDRLDSGARPQPLPSELKVQLPDLTAPYTRLVVGADVILVDRDTHIIADVIPAVAY